MLKGGTLNSGFEGLKSIPFTSFSASWTGDLNVPSTLFLLGKKLKKQA